MMNNVKSGAFFSISSIISVAGWVDLYQMCVTNKFIYASVKWQILLVFTALLAISQLIGLILLCIPASSDKFLQFLNKITAIKLPGIAIGVLLAGLSLSYALLIYSGIGIYFTGIYFRAFLLWMIAMLGALATGENFRKSFVLRMAAVFLLSGLGFVLLGFRKDISTSPLTLSWSEASRYYYASLFTSTRLYGQRLAWSFLHPSRYLLQAIPFFIGDFPIVVHRIWQVALWLIMPGITIYLFIRRIAPMKRIKAWVFAIWSFLFLYQGPVYYHLLVCVWLVFLGYDKRKTWKTLLFVFLASLWAGISRVNWFPVPAMIAITLYVLDHPFPGRQKTVSYLVPPVIYSVVGLASAFGSQVLYAYLSGVQDLGSFGSSFTSDLLWYRLLPNSTSQLGIVLPAIVLTLPVLLLVLVNVWKARYAFLQWIMIAGIVLVLFAGGLVVSVKIGGGANLHNLDAWLVLIWILAGKMLVLETHERNAAPQNLWLPGWLLVLILAFPAAYHIDIARTDFANIANWVDVPAATEESKNIMALAEQAHNSGEEVLFISQRQLLIFEPNDIPLVPDYELLTLMEMAISNNQAYLQTFTQDLENHRFGMIIVEKQIPKINRDDNAYFSEENNAWVENITLPLLETYQEQHFYPVSRTTIMIPKQ